MVAGVYPRHKLGDTEYGGFAYFGKQIPGKEEAAPFENKEAEKIWDEVTSLFDVDIKRADDEYGTDVLIFMSSVDLDKIKTAIEDYYFPALIDGKINVKFYDVKGDMSLPTPHERKDLEQFINLVNEAKRDTKEKTESKEVAALKKVKGCKIGRIAFEAAETNGIELPRNNCVAIMRGTGMIINYVRHGLEQYEPVVGAFVADKEVWPYLVASENAPHSKWNDKSKRLQRDFPEDGEEIVKRLNGNVKTRFINFQKSLQPDVSVTRNESGLLARLLSGALSGSPGSGPIPAGDPNPVGLSLTPCQSENGISKWRLLIQSNDQTPDEEFILKLSPSISIAGDLRKVSVKNMDFKVTNKAGKIFSPSDLESIKFQKGSPVDLFITYDNPKKWNYIVKCKCKALMEIEQ